MSADRLGPTLTATPVTGITITTMVTENTPSKMSFLVIAIRIFHKIRQGIERTDIRLMYSLDAVREVILT
jgi:hypothetical protein